MKKLSILLISLVLVSACVIQDGDTNVLLNMFSMKAVDSLIEDITITGRMPTFVLEERDFPFEIKIESNKDIEDVNLEIYDQCPPFSKNIEEHEYIFGPIKIKESDYRTFTSGYDVDEVDFKRDGCKINFKTNYSSTLNLNQEVMVLPYLEYERIESEENISAVPISSFSTINPLRITLSFSKERPIFIDDTEVSMHIDYENMGEGKIEKLEPYSLSIKVPNLFKIKSSDEYIAFKTTNNKHIVAFKTPKMKEFVYVTKITIPMDSIPDGAKYMSTINDIWFYLEINDEGAKLYQESGPQYFRYSDIPIDNLPNDKEVFLFLAEEKTFVKKKASKSTINFETKSIDAKQTGFIELDVNYDYEIISEIGPIEVRKR